MFQGLFFSFVLLYCSLDSGAALKCVNCIWSDSDSHNNECFANMNSSTIEKKSINCSTDYQQPPYHCVTKFSFKTGIISEIQRQCISKSRFSFTKLGTLCKTVPYQDKCISTFNPIIPSESDIDSYSACETDSCNTDQPKPFSTCNGGCGSYGECNTFTGKCVCNSGYSGDQCQKGLLNPVETHLKCVQCDSETNSDCQNKKESTNCPCLTHKYCSVTFIRGFDSDGKKNREFLSRTCTKSRDGTNACYLSRDKFNDIVYTCKTACNWDGCNTEIPDDATIENSNFRPRCVVCDSKYGLDFCANKEDTERCPSSATYCTAEVSYFISDDDDQLSENNNLYQLATVNRNCSSSTVAKECKETSIPGTKLKKVTCIESCSEDGCNSGWPARPKCFQCTDSSCLSNQAEPTRCHYPYQKYCVVEDRNRRINVLKGGFKDGLSRSINRDCSYISFGNRCVPSNDDPITLQNCNKTCTEDGCNSGNRLSAVLMKAHVYLLPLIFMSIMASTF